jgi:hypothetical protein
MNEELQNKIFDKYPKIFRDRTLPMTQTCMCWGLSIGDGWSSIVESLCAAATYTYSTSVHVDKKDGERMGIKPYVYTDGTVLYSFDVQPPQMVADQVKEKFGTLRFYFHLEFDPKLIELAKIETRFSWIRKLCGLKPKMKYPDVKEVMDRYSNYFDGIVHFAETLSEMTCEDTGKPGEMHVSGGIFGGWYRTLNKEYAKADPALVERNYVPVASLKEDPIDFDSKNNK